MLLIVTLHNCVYYRPCLTWRDVQSLVVYTVLPIDFVDAQWVENRAGFNHSHLHGFGVLDAYRLTMAAKVSTHDGIIDGIR